MFTIKIIEYDEWDNKHEIGKIPNLTDEITLNKILALLLDEYNDYPEIWLEIKEN